jgi:hypothetical protein
MKSIGAVVVFVGLAAITACGGKTVGSSDINGGGGGGAGSDAGHVGTDGGGGGDTDGGSIVPPAEHRSTATACGASIIPGEPDLNIMFASNATFDCKANADCNKQQGGRCTIKTCGPGGPACEPQGTVCAYDACSTDFDCMGSSGVCDCGSGPGSTNRCIDDSGCRTDKDCGSNGYCSPSKDACDSLIGGYYCHSTADQCVNDSDCTGSNFGSSCTYENNRWECAQLACAASAE